MTKDWIVTTAKKGDEVQICALFRTTLGAMKFVTDDSKQQLCKAWNETYIRSRMNGSSYLIAVTKTKDNKIIGSALAYAMTPESYRDLDTRDELGACVWLSWIGRSADTPSKGVATALMNRVFQYAAEKQITRIECAVHRGNKASIAAMSRWGFERKNMILLGAQAQYRYRKDLPAQESYPPLDTLVV